MANLYHLFGDGFEAIYRAAVDPADSTLVLTNAGVTQNFSGSQIRSVATPVGDLVTLVTDASGPTTFSVFVPEANVPPGQGLGFSAIGVWKTVVPPIVLEARWTPIALTGIAKTVFAPQ
jgi:hypothetical protein